MNKALVNTYKTMQRQINEITPNIFAGFVLALYRRNVLVEEIESILSSTQQIWQEAIDNDIKMREYCLNETGIDVQRKVE